SSAGGRDTVNVGNAANGVQSILGALTVTNPPSFTTLNLNDQAGPAARTATLSVSGGTGTVSGPAPAPIHYPTGDVSTLTVNGGSRGNTFNLQATAVTTVVNAGSGSDTINVGSAANTLDAIRGGLTVNGQGGTNTLNINDQGSTTPHTYTVTATTV